MKLQILASYNNLRIGQNSEFAQFLVFTWGIANVKIDQALTFGMPKKIEWVYVPLLRLKVGPYV